ncbi:hypothetical protein F5Y17DRAFT_297741 [Xylariaceae sp. FL0594]|nr:hypothetical protein F5Y17DRAFT_297741 [Xylariaceae sp. FL0594]
MAPSHSTSPLGSHSAKLHTSKLKPKEAVKPILRKWTQSDKEKQSTDLDRVGDEQDRNGGMKNGATYGSGRDSSLSLHDRTAVIDEGPEAADSGGLGVVGGTASARRFNHSRSISGNSHVSIATSSSSNVLSAPRQTGATFVHPFQQTPRTSTPPLLSYANSLASIPDARDYSPTTITEDNDNEETVDIADPSTQFYRPQLYHASNSSSHGNGSNATIHCTQTMNSSSHSLSQHGSASLQRPSIASQRTSSYTDTATIYSTMQSSQQPPRLKISSRAPSVGPIYPSRLANISSRSELDHDYSLDPTSPSILPNVTTPSASTMPTMSPLRTSFDSGFRLRAKSDLDTVTRAEHLRAARRKFEEKERRKDEKYAQEEIKRRERADNKRAQEIEKQLAARHKAEVAAKVRQEAAELEEALQRGKHNRKISIASSGRPSLSIPRPSLTLGRPNPPRKNASGQSGESEKFMGNSYDNTDMRNPPAYDQERLGTQSLPFNSSKRKRTKKKTQSAWTAFVLWLRTKLLRMANH